MGIIGNKSILYKSPATFIGGGATGLGNDPARNNVSARRNRYTSPDYSQLAATPMGAAPGVSWIFPIKAGAMASINNAELDVTATAYGWMGLPTEGAATFGITFADSVIFPIDDTSPARTASASYTITFADATGSLITSGTGTAEISITANPLTMTASLDANGSTSYAISGNTSLLGAIASGIGSSVITFSAFADILPLDDTPPARNANATYTLSAFADILPIDDTPPARNANATYTITGSLVPYAIGQMVGNALPYTELSPQSLAAAVWDSLVSEYQQPGSTGEALFAAGGGTTPTSIWQYAIEGAYSAEEILRLMSAVLAGKVSGAAGTAITFRDLDDTKNRITATVDSDGNRTTVTKDVS
jgi:hypothetical protein